MKNKNCFLLPFGSLSCQSNEKQKVAKKHFYKVEESYRSVIPVSWVCAVWAQVVPCRGPCCPRDGKEPSTPTAAQSTDTV